MATAAGGHSVVLPLDAETANAYARSSESDYVQPSDVAHTPLPAYVWQIVGCIRDDGEHDNRIRDYHKSQFGYYILLDADFPGTWTCEGSADLVNVQGGRVQNLSDEHGGVLEGAVTRAPRLPPGFHSVYAVLWKPKFQFGDAFGIVCDVQGSILAATFVGHMPTWIVRSIGGNAADPIELL